MTRTIYKFNDAKSSADPRTEELGLALERFLNRKHATANATFKFRPNELDVTVELSRADDEIQAYLYFTEADCFLAGLREARQASPSAPQPHKSLSGDPPQYNYSYEHNFYSGMALIKRDDKFEIVEMARVLDDIKAYHPEPPPYVFRELLLDETPREFRTNVDHLLRDVNTDSVEAHIRDLAAKGTEFFPDGKEVFARLGVGICFHVCSCQTEQGARIAAGVMEWLRYFSDELGMKPT